MIDWMVLVCITVGAVCCVQIGIIFERFRVYNNIFKTLSTLLCPDCAAKLKKGKNTHE